jgi:hypothetical protein
VTPTNNERVIINTTGSAFATSLSVYTNVCGALGNAVDSFGTVQCSRVGGNGNANVSFSSVGNVVYHVLVGGTTTSDYGSLEITAIFTNPPANDTCVNAIALTNGVPNIMDTTYATEIGYPTNGCAAVGHGVWFTLNVFSNQQVTISTCGSSYNTDLMVYTNGCGSLGNAIYCSSGGNPFNCGNGQAAGLSFVPTNNATYYILASGVGTASGTLTIVANQPPPTNDMCSSPILMTAGVTYSNDTTYASSINDPVPTNAPSLGRGVWYSYAPSVSGLVGVTTSGSSFQTALAVYTGSCDSLTEVASSQNSGAYNNSGKADINFYGTSGTTYYILVGGVSGTAGTLQILIPVVDLVATGLVATNPVGGLATAGRMFFASWMVQNQGSNSINGAWTDQLVLSNANSTTVLATFPSPHNAPAGGSYTATFSNILPQIQWGNYTLIARADISNAVAEINKTNNSQVISLTVTDIPPAVTLFIPTNTLQLTSCVPLVFILSAGVQAGSYTITNVSFYNAGTLIGLATNAPYLTQSLPLDHGSNIIRAQVFDSFGLNAFSTNGAIVVINWPNQTNVLRADMFSNTCVVCMAALNGTNYVIEATTNLNSAAWQALVTNQVTGSILVFTNQMTTPKRFYRSRY